MPAGDEATTRMPAADEATTRMPAGDEGVTGKIPTAGAAAAGAAAAGGVAAAKFAGGKEESATAKIAAVGDEPYGPGSARVAAGGKAPSGYTIKGNEDSMLYHTTDSPSYGVTIAEIWFRTADAAERAGFTRWDKGSPGAAAAGAAAAGGVAASKFAGGQDEAATARIAAVGDEPYGAGSARVAAGASAPSGYTIKGNEDSMLYHTTDSPWYKQTIAEVWFRTEEAAERSGFTRWDKGRAARGGAATFADVPPGPHGPGSAKPSADGSGPAGWTVKGNEDSMLYHTTDSPWYKQTIAEVWFRTEEAADRAGFTRWDKGRAASGGAATFADVPPGPHGPGSAKPSADGSGPAGWTVKGNEDSMLYHSPDSPAYEVTVAEVWFRDEETAVAAGFARWDSGKSQRREK